MLYLDKVKITLKSVERKGNNMAIENKQRILKLAQLGILLALVVVLQSVVSFGFVNICLCLVPITIGAILLDWKGGLILGAMFGVVALFWGVTGKDQFTFFLFAAHPVMTIAICLVKGSLAGVVPALLYKWLSRYKYNNSRLVGAIVASILAPIVNTGVFAIGSLIIKDDVIKAMTMAYESAGAAPPDMSNFVAYLFLTLIGVNFIIEFVINVVLSPAIHKITEIASK